MIITKQTIPRRTVLRGLGAAVGLPLVRARWCRCWVFNSVALLMMMAAPQSRYEIACSTVKVPPSKFATQVFHLGPTPLLLLAICTGRRWLAT